jgi:simple sugar transport system permease protein
MEKIFLAVSLISVFRISTPLILASLGGFYSERSGIVNLALEGMMLFGAFSAAVGAILLKSSFLGLVCGVLGGMLMSFLHALLCIRFRGDQIISGMAINMLAMGVPPVVLKYIFDMTGGTPSLDYSIRLHAIYGLSPIMILALFLVLFSHFIFHYFRFGQWIRFSGENPLTLQTQGVSVDKVRFISVLISGILCGLAGAYLSIDHGSGFTRNMTAGRGFIALAALILGRWTPLGAFFSSLLFGFIEWLQTILQGVKFGEMVVPVQWIYMIPYIATLLILGGAFMFKGKMRVPRALGKTWILIFFMFFLQGCNFIEIKNFFLEKVFKVESQKKEEPIVEPLLSNNKDKIYGEFIKELYLVVLQREVRDFEFERILNALAQGASYEGIYNGILYSEEYRAKEKGMASPSAIHAYADLMTKLTVWIQFDSAVIQKKEEQEKPDVPKPNLDVKKEIPKPTEEEIKNLKSKFEKEVIEQGYSFYTLKRKASETLIKVIEVKKLYKEKLATWYADFTVYMNQQGVDFGLKERNNQDEYFQYKWALQTDLDLIKWESINRIHRYLNAKEF